MTLLEVEEEKHPKAGQRRLEARNACDMYVARDGRALALHRQVATWLAAWDGFAVGAAIVGMMPYKAAVRHKLTIQVNTACDMYVPVMGVRCCCVIRKWCALQWLEAASL